jgi:hypothetical protein
MVCKFAFSVKVVNKNFHPNKALDRGGASKTKNPSSKSEGPGNFRVDPFY